jgi:hypothetical protein
VFRQWSDQRTGFVCRIEIDRRGFEASVLVPSGHPVYSAPLPESFRPALHSPKPPVVQLRNGRTWLVFTTYHADQLPEACTEMIEQLAKLMED